MTILPCIVKIEQKDEARRVNITNNLSDKQETANGPFEDVLEQISKQISETTCRDLASGHLA